MADVYRIADMEYTPLGKNGLKVSVVGLGCGSHSRLGQTTGKSERESVAPVRWALDLGITLLDTSEIYGTESIVGKAIQKIYRDKVVFSSKKMSPPIDHPNPAREIKKSFEESLRRLTMDTIDIYHLHGGRFSPYHQGRFDYRNGMTGSCDIKAASLPSAYLKNLYYDAMVYRVEVLEFLRRTGGADHIMVGTDCPFNLGDWMCMEKIEALDCPDDEKKAILAGNARRLLKL